MKKVLIFMFFALIMFGACEKGTESNEEQALLEEIAELKALLNEQKAITDVSFEGNQMTITFANGETVTTEIPSSVIPRVGDNGNWWVGDTDTGVQAKAEMPTIGTNGNWWIGDTDTGIKAQGATGAQGDAGTGIENVEYDGVTGILKITLTDGTSYEYKLFYDENLAGIKLGDLNGKYLLSEVWNGDFPFLKMLYNTDNRLTDVEYYTNVLNAPVKNFALTKTYNANGDISSQTFKEFALVDKAKQVGRTFPDLSWEDGGLIHADYGVSLSASEVISDLNIEGRENSSLSDDEFVRYLFQDGPIFSSIYFYELKQVNLYDEDTEEYIQKEIVYRKVCKDINDIAITIRKGEALVWAGQWSDYYNNFSDYNPQEYGRLAYQMTIDEFGNLNTVNGTYKSVFKRVYKAEIFEGDVNEKSDDTFTEYIAPNMEKVDNWGYLGKTYKIKFKTYNLYKAGDEIDRYELNYVYNGADFTIREDQDTMLTIKVENDRIAALVAYDEDEEGVLTEMTVLKMNYNSDGLLETISSPELEIENVVKIIYDAKRNPIEIQVNSKEFEGEGWGEALAALGLAYRTEVYDDELGMVVEKYIYPEDYTAVLKMKYDYTMKNFMNHTITASNPLFGQFNSGNAISEFIWAGHGSCFVAEYMDYNEGGYPTKFKGLLQASPIEFDDNPIEYPINGSVATTYKLKYKKIEE
jgi:hypothetical protein